MNNTTVDYYSLLDVPKNASADDIKKSFRVLAHRYHPDKNPKDSGSEEKFKNISKAYEILGDPQKRVMYDRTGRDNYSDMFRSGGGMGCAGKRGCCGRGRRRSEPAFDVHEINLTREEAFNGTTIGLSIDEGGETTMHKINLPGRIENGTVLRYNDSNIGADFLIRVVYSDG